MDSLAPLFSFYLSILKYSQLLPVWFLFLPRCKFLLLFWSCSSLTTDLSVRWSDSFFHSLMLCVIASESDSFSLILLPLCSRSYILNAVFLVPLWDGKYCAFGFCSTTDAVLFFLYEFDHIPARYVYLTFLYFTYIFLNESNIDRCTYKYLLNWKK